MGSMMRYQLDFHTLSIAVRLYVNARDAEARRIFLGAIRHLLETAGVDLLVVEGYLIERERASVTITRLEP